MKLIDADKLLAWMQIAFEKESKDRYEKGKRDMHTMVEALIHQGHFDPEQHEQIQVGDTVKHVDKRMKTYGIGVVLKISKSGDRVLVDWPNYDKEKLPWQPTRSYFRIDKLEVVSSSPKEDTASDI